MRKSGLSLVLVFLVTVFLLDAYAAEMAGVTLPDTTKVGDTSLLLNGLGVRKKFVVKVYVAGLYLKQKSSDPGAILKSEEPKRLVMHFVHDVGKDQLADGFSDSFKNNSPDAAKTMKADIDTFLGSLEPVKEGDEVAFTFVPGQGTTVAIKGKDKVTITNAAFAPVLFSVWLGPKPPNADLKKGLLGQQ